MLAAIVGGLAVPITLRLVVGVVASTIATAIVSPSERRLLVEPWRLEEHLARDRGHDRQDHDRQHDRGGEQRAPVRRRVAEDREKAEVVVQPYVRGLQVTRQVAAAPEA